MFSRLTVDPRSQARRPEEALARLRIVHERGVLGGVTAFVLAVSVCAAPRLTPSPQTAQPSGYSGSWRTAATVERLLQGYLGTDRPMAVSEVARWNNNELIHFHREVVRGCGVRRLSERNCGAAVLLLLEAAMQVPAWASGPFFNVARDLLQSAFPKPLPGSIRAKLQIAVAHALQEHLRVDDLKGHLRYAQSEFPTDPELLLASGSLAELLASDRTRAGREAGLAPHKQDSLREAEQLYRKALAAAPRLDEARLRLGRVLYLEGRAAESLQFLEPLAESTRADATTYLALLFSAAAHSHLGEDEAATRQYELAAARCSTCTAARLGLARLAYPGSSRHQAATILEAALRQAQFVAPDPRDLYDFGQAQRLPGEIDELRESLGR